MWALAAWCAVYLEISRQAGNDALAPATFAHAGAAAGMGRGYERCRARAYLQLGVLDAGGRLYGNCSGLRVRRGHGEEVKSLEVPCCWR